MFSALSSPERAVWVRALAPVVRKVDNAIHRINRIVWFVLLTLIHWIAIYPVDSVIQPLSNRGLAGNIVLCSWARHFTLTVHLSTHVYKLVGWGGGGGGGVDMD